MQINQWEPFNNDKKKFKKMFKKSRLEQVIVKVTSMVSWDSDAQKLAKKAGLNINYVSWEDCARNKGSCWGPCISDMTLRVNDSCMPVIRQPNYSDITWDVKMSDVPIVIGNHCSDKSTELQTISLSDYLSNFSDFVTNKEYKKEINLLSQKESKDSHVIMSSQACFLPIQSGEETKFNVALFNYQSKPKNPAVLVIVSTAKGSSAQIIEGKEQHLLFNNFGKKADFIAERVSDVRRKKGQTNIHDKVLSKEEKQDNVIVVVQIPLKQKKPKQPAYDPFPANNSIMDGGFGFGGGGGSMYGNNNNNGLSELCADECGMDCFCDSFGSFSMPQSAPQQQQSIQQTFSMSLSQKSAPKPNVEAAQVKVSERTKPVCICGQEMEKCQAQFAYSGGGVNCDECGKSIINKQSLVYHCKLAKNWKHSNGYDLCIECGDKQLQFDEFRGLLKDDKDYVLERNEDYPIRCTLQYYKATSNGVVNKEIMDDIVKQLEASQKQADFMGSLVTEYNPNRPNEWINNNKDENKDDDVMVMDVNNVNDEYKQIRKFLKENGGKDWEKYVKNFEEEEVKDTDVVHLSDADMAQLIGKIGPRNRFKKWSELRKNRQDSVDKWMGNI